MQIKLSSGGYDIIASGVACLFGQSNDLVIHVTEDNNFDICVTLKFENDDLGEYRIDRDITEKGLLLTCFNFDGIGTGLRTPKLIANVNGKNVYLMFWVYSEGQNEPKVRSVKYSIFYEN